MSKIYSPKIVTDGLVMCLDPSQNKSYATTDLPVKGGLALWLDAADDATFSYSSGTSISQWRDKSGNNRHFFQSTAGNQPSRSAVVNSRKAIQFTAASSNYLRFNSRIINNTTAGSVFVVWRTAGETQAYSSILDNYHCGSNALGAGFQIERNVTNNQYYWGFQTSSCVQAGFIPATSYSNDTTNCIWITKDSTTITGGLNGTSGTPSASPSATWIEDDKGWTIGCWGAGTESFGRFFNGIHCEVLIFNRGLSPVEVRQVNTYLAQKWGISNTDRSIIDLSGFNDNGLFGDGTTSNMPAYDYYNKGGFRFDGSNDFIKVGANSSLQVNNVTIAAFFKTVNNGQSVQFITGYGDTGLAGYWIGMSGGPIRFSVGGGSGNYLQQSSGITPNNDQIYYVVGTYDGTNQRIYINGALQASATTVTGNISYTGLTDGFLLGQVQGFTAGRYLTGYIYYAQVYNRALSAAEISQNYEALKSRFANTIVQSGLVLNLDAGNPYSYAGAGTTWYDVSGNSYNGTLTNGPTYSSDNSGIITFDGTNDNVQLGNASTFLPTSAITINCWAKTNVVGVYKKLFVTVAAGTAAITGIFFSLGPSPDGIYLGIITSNGTQYATSTTNPSTTLFNNFCGTYDGVNINLYLNGILIATKAQTGNIINSGIARISGYDNGGEIWDGSVSNFSIYNRALSATEVLQNYNATKGRFGL